MPHDFSGICTSLILLILFSVGPEDTALSCNRKRHFVAMDISDDVLRMILERLKPYMKNKVQLLQVSRQFNRVVGDMFAKQRKLSIGYSNKDCAATDHNHEVSEEDVLKFETDFPARGRYSQHISHLKQALNTIIWLLNKCPNLGVLVVTRKWGYYRHTLSVQCLNQALRIILPFVSEKLCCLVIDGRSLNLSQVLVKKLKTRSLIHLWVPRITDAAKKLLVTNNPNIVIETIPPSFPVGVQCVVS